MSRDKRKNLLIKNIVNTSDEIITNIYNTIWQLCEEESDTNKKESRIQKIKYIKTNLDFISDDDLSKINEIIDNANDNQIKYDLLLDMLNELLDHLQLKKIANIINFKDIPRDILATNECKQIVLNKKEDIINAGFEKNANGFHTYKNLKYAHINIIKGLCKQLGYDFKSTIKSKMSRGNRTFTTYYYIEKA